MVKSLIIYGPPADELMFRRHMDEVHVRLAARLPAVRRIVLGRVVPPDSGPPPPYYQVNEVIWDTIEDLQFALRGDAGRAARSDLAEFATGGVISLLCEHIEVDPSLLV